MVVAMFAQLLIQELLHEPGSEAVGAVQTASFNVWQPANRGLRHVPGKGALACPPVSLI